MCICIWNSQWCCLFPTQRISSRSKLPRRGAYSKYHYEDQLRQQKRLRQPQTTSTTQKGRSTQPPIRIIGRFVTTSIFSIPACFSFLPCTALPIISSRSESDAPRRIESRRESSFASNRQTLICPSAVILSRLQLAQKWSDMLLMKPIVPVYPGIFHERAVSFSSSGARPNVGWAFDMRKRSSEEGNILALSHLFPMLYYQYIIYQRRMTEYLC